MRRCGFVVSFCLSHEEEAVFVKCSRDCVLGLLRNLRGRGRVDLQLRYRAGSIIFGRGEDQENIGDLLAP
jgi:hypothetical protein